MKRNQKEKDFPKPQDSSDEIKFFNDFAKKMDYDTLTPYGYQSIIRVFDQLLGSHISNISHAIDLGCGTGSFTRYLMGKRKIRTFGVDIAFEAIRRAKEKKDGIEYFVSNIRQLGIKNESADLVIFSGVLHHFPQPQECLNEAYRILKQGGVLLSYDPHINNPCMWLYRHPASPFFSRVGKTANEKLLKKKDMKQALGETGFVNIKTQAISGVTMSYLESKVARMILPLYNITEYLLGLSPLAEKFGSFLICYANKNGKVINN